MVCPKPIEMAWYLSHGSQHHFVVNTSPDEFLLYHDLAIIVVCDRNDSHRWLAHVFTYNVQKPLDDYEMVRAPGIEPGTPAWKAGVLPLNYARFCEASTF